MRRLPIVLVALLAAGCGASEPSRPPGVNADEVLYIRDAADTVRGIDVRTGRDATRRPLGVTATVDGRQITFSVRTQDQATRVEARDAAGTLRAHATVPGTWALSEPAQDGTMEGVSANGRTLALTGPSGGRFAILDTSLAGAPTIVSLGRRFAYDALSPDGQTLYVIEHLNDPRHPGRYQVRAFDLGAGRLQPGFIADKRELDEPMAGYPLARATTPDGAWVYTLYQGPEHAFVHALATTDGYALCIDLPGGPQRRDAAAYWGLALDGETVYAANAAIGVAAALNGPAGEVARDGRLPVAAGERLRDRREGRGAVAGSGGAPRVALSPDGRTLYAIGPRGLTAIDPLSLRARDRLVTSRRLAGIALSPDARRVYAVDATTRAVLALDARSGRRLGAVDGASGAVSLLGVVRSSR
jgi:DNA-binding beta-propeller fold protein YncE